MRGSVLLILATVIAAHPVLAEQRKGRQPGPSLSDGTVDAIASYRSEPECEGLYFGVTKAFLAIDEFAAEASRVQRKPDMIAMSQSVASRWNAFAGAAAAKGCGPTARRLYLYVIETFTGSAYAAMRQRAQIGIDDLRAASAAPVSRESRPAP